MEERVVMLEKDVTAIKSQLAVIQSNYCVREDVKALVIRFDAALPHLATKADLEAKEADEK